MAAAIKIDLTPNPFPHGKGDYAGRYRRLVITRAAPPACNGTSRLGEGIGRVPRGIRVGASVCRRARLSACGDGRVAPRPYGYELSS